MKFAVITWWIWRWRNEAVFNEKLVEEHLKIEHIKKSVEEMISSHGMVTCTERPTQHFLEVDCIGSLLQGSAHGCTGDDRKEIL